MWSVVHISVLTISQDLEKNNLKSEWLTLLHHAVTSSKEIASAIAFSPAYRMK
jgi:hypothetical protein